MNRREFISTAAAAAGTVTPKELNAHIRAWKEQGVRTVPLVNFSVLRSGWMGFPSRMVAWKVRSRFRTRRRRNAR